MTVFELDSAFHTSIRKKWKMREDEYRSFLESATEEEIDEKWENVNESHQGAKPPRELAWPRVLYPKI